MLGKIFITKLQPHLRVVLLSADVFPLSHLPDSSFDLLMASEEESLGLGAEEAEGSPQHEENEEVLL